MYAINKLATYKITVNKNHTQPSILDKQLIQHRSCSCRAHSSCSQRISKADTTGSLIVVSSTHSIKQNLTHECIIRQFALLTYAHTSNSVRFNIRVILKKEHYLKVFPKMRFCYKQRI